MTSIVDRHAHRVARQFDELISLTDLAERRAERISGWSVGQHLHHLIKSDHSILGYFAEPTTEAARPVTAIGRIVLWTGWIPRGKGKAPAATQPEAPDGEELRAGIERERALFAAAVAERQPLLAPEPIGNHPFFGGLNRVQWLRFLAVHHHHHIKIIRDVLRAHPA